MGIWDRAARRLRRLAWLIGLSAAVAMGCGGEGSGSGTSGGGGPSGKVLIGLTDEAGDFVRYEVGVVSVHLTRASGEEVWAVPIETRVDFARLTELSEFVTAVTVPNGVYRAVTLTLDYEGAEVWVEQADGTPVKAQLSGLPANAILELDVELDGRTPLVVSPGVTAYLSLDFDLAATQEVDSGTAPPTVTVHPTLVAEVSPDRPKVHRARGPLVSVDQTERTFTLAVRPFRVRNPRNLGQIVVQTSPETVYEVDGAAGAGEAGFALLAAKPAGTSVVALGDLEIGSRTFRAREVYAGTSVPGGTADAFAGTVLARSGLDLTVRGATLDRADGALFLNQDVTVSLTEETTLTRQGRGGGPVPPSAVSVGQHIFAFGVYDPETASMTADHGRLLVTRMAGTVVEKRNGEIDLALQHIEGRRIALFDFSGTGGTAGEDADPALYTAATGGLPLSSVAPGDPVRVRGFVTAFGAAPPDFEALSVADGSEAVAHLAVGWAPGVKTALEVDAATDTLTLNLADSLVHAVTRAGVRVELEASPAPTVAPADPGRGLFALHHKKGPTAVYSRYDEFEQALKDEIEATPGSRIASLTALGSFDPETQAFAARKIVARLR